MKVTYSTTFVATCPVDGTLDVYDLELRTLDTLIPVELILAVIREVTAEPAYQEQITAELAERLDAIVTTTGVHSGVTTVAEA